MTGLNPVAALRHDLRTPVNRLIADFLDAVEARRQPQASARSALAIHALIDAILESSRRGTAVDVASSA